MRGCDPERWQEIERLYHSALELPVGSRPEFLKQACGEDGQLKQEVASLLSLAEADDNFLEAPAIEVAAKAIAVSADTQTHAEARRPEGPGAPSFPAFIGQYRVIRLLGEGGMGAVYEAEQRQPRRIVALKLIRAGFCTPETLRRFEHESQALARLQHAGIAQIYEAGTADTGFGVQPYFAMELIRGQPLATYAELNRLGTRQRLELMVRICEAVHHAHQRGLIHRDLKPSNILVDETGQPKILDFGVARMAEREEELTRQTSTGQIVGTLSYMSPEQVLADPLELDIRSDIYSLGVILYELLTGRLPYTVSERQLPEAMRTIREEDPASLSSINRSYRGDIETIVRKALEKDKARRYGSAAELAADIRRYLNDEPIAARPPSAAYQLQKFVRRHVAGAAIVSVVVIALCGITVSVAWEARIAREERDRAQQRFNEVRGLARHIIFDLQNELAAIPGTTVVRKNMVAMAVRYLDTLAKDARSDQSLQSELAAAYIQIGDIQGNPENSNVGDLPAALESYAKAERLARTLAAAQGSGPAKRLLVDALMAEAYAAKYARQTQKGANIAMEALRVARERARAEPASSDVQLQLGSALQCVAAFRAPKDTLPLLSEEVSDFEGMLARNPKNLDRRRNAALAHKYLAATFLTIKNPDGAFQHLERAEELDAACVSAAPDDPMHRMDLAIDLGQWGEYWEKKNDIAKAMQYTLAALAIRRELASADPRDMWARNRLAYNVGRLGDLQLDVSARHALASYQEARSIAERLQPESLRAVQLAHAIAGVGAAYQKLGNASRACTAFAESTKLYREVVKESPVYADELTQAEKAYSRCLHPKMAHPE